MLEEKFAVVYAKEKGMQVESLKRLINDGLEDFILRRKLEGKKEFYLLGVFDNFKEACDFMGKIANNSMPTQIVDLVLSSLKPYEREEEVNG